MPAEQTKQKHPLYTRQLATCFEATGQQTSHFSRGMLILKLQQSNGSPGMDDKVDSANATKHEGNSCVDATSGQ